MALPVDEHYNKISNLYDYGLGFGTFWLLKKLQLKAVKEIGLKKGDVVLDLGCGTGLLFKDLIAAVGKSGKVIAIDISPKMIKKAQDKIDKNNWKNIELICADLTKKDLNIKADAAIFCLVLSLIPNYEEIICKTLRLLKSNSPLVVVDSWKQYKKWHHKLIF